MRKKHRNMCGTRDGGCSAVTAGGGVHREETSGTC